MPFCLNGSDQTKCLFLFLLTFEFGVIPILEEVLLLFKTILLVLFSGNFLSCSSFIIKSFDD